MSADNWAICPRCLVEFDKANEKLKLDAGAAYGKVNPNEYLRLLAEADKASARALEPTFREDYSIGVSSTGVFEVDYSGACSKCGLAFSHNTHIPVDMSTPAAARSAKARGKGEK